MGRLSGGMSCHQTACEFHRKLRRCTRCAECRQCRRLPAGARGIRRQATDDDAAEARSLAVELRQLSLAMGPRQHLYHPPCGSLSPLWGGGSRVREKVAGFRHQRITNLRVSVQVASRPGPVNPVVVRAPPSQRLAWFAPEPLPVFMFEVPLPGIAVEDRRGAC